MNIQDSINKYNAYDDVDARVEAETEYLIRNPDELFEFDIDEISGICKHYHYTPKLIGAAMAGYISILAENHAQDIAFKAGKSSVDKKQELNIQEEVERLLNNPLEIYDADVEEFLRIFAKHRNYPLAGWRCIRAYLTKLAENIS